MAGVVALEQLRYVRLAANDLGRAADFAQRVLGLEPIDRTPEVATFRSDFRDYTLAFESNAGTGQSLGLEVRYSSDLDAALEGLVRLGLTTGRGTAEECARRKVKDMAWFADFSGNRIELALGAFIGAVTFSGSVIAFGKLSGKYKFRLFQGAPVVFKGQHMVNLVIGLAILGLGLYFTFTGNITAFVDNRVGRGVSQVRAEVPGIMANHNKRGP